jgi:hypothetical protein
MATQAATKDSPVKKRNRNGVRKPGRSKKDTAKKEFDNILKKVEDNDADLDAQVHSGNFFRDKSELLQQQTTLQKNLLHLLAEFQRYDDGESSGDDDELKDEQDEGGGSDGEEGDSDKDSTDGEPAPGDTLLESLVIGLVTHFNDLMLMPDKSKRTPLLVAIEASNEDVVSCMLKKCQNIEEVLATAGKSSRSKRQLPARSSKIGFATGDSNWID